MEGERPRPATRAVHAGTGAAPARRPVATPIFQTAPFAFGSSGELVAAFAEPEQLALYSRQGNPTVAAAEAKVASLEGARGAVAFASGMAATSGLLSCLLRPGERLLAAAEVYGGTGAWLDWMAVHRPDVAVERQPLARLGDRVADEAAPAPRLVFAESPANPLLACCDLPDLAERCRRRGALLAVDSTFATPAVQTPLALGADLVVHSATKFLGGHSDLVAGVVAAACEEHLAALRGWRELAGGCLDPFAAFLLDRGIKTLFVRLERQSATAARLADELGRHPAVRRVFYPGFDEVARRQMRLGGGMVSFEVAGGLEAARRVLDRLAVFAIIPSLGGVESGAVAPAIASHRRLSPAERAALGIAEGLVRLSVGLEDPGDLSEDLLQALAPETAA